MSNRKTITIAVSVLAIVACTALFMQTSGGGDRNLSTNDPSGTRKTSSSSSSRENSKSKTRKSESNRFQSLTDYSIRWQVRVNQLRRMDATSLTPREVDYLYSLLKQPPQGHSNEAWWVVVNEVMEQIEKQNIDSERIVPEFCAIILDSSLDPVVRDYAVQHICNYMKARTEVSEGQLESTLNSLLKVIQDPINQHNTIPGTSLMGLVQLSTNPELSLGVREKIIELDSYLNTLIAGDSSAVLANRTSAINVVGLLKLEQYQPKLRDLISSDITNASARLSSIAALGDFYSEPSDISPDEKSFDRELLNSLATGNTKFKYAASEALKKIQ